MCQNFIRHCEGESMVKARIEDPDYESGSDSESDSDCSIVEELSELSDGESDWWFDSFIQSMHIELKSHQNTVLGYKNTQNISSSNSECSERG